MKTCTECGHQMGENAPACPQCGEPVLFDKEIELLILKKEINRIEGINGYRICKSCGAIKEGFTNDEYTYNKSKENGVLLAIIWFFVIFISCGLGLILYFFLMLFEKIEARSNQKNTFLGYCSVCDSSKIVKANSEEGIKELHTRGLSGNDVLELIKEQIEISKEKIDKQKREAKRKKDLKELRSKNCIKIFDIICYEIRYIYSWIYAYCFLPLYIKIKKHWIISLFILTLVIGFSIDIYNNPKVYGLNSDIKNPVTTIDNVNKNWRTRLGEQ